MESGVILAVIGLVGTIFGAVMLFLGSRGQTKASAKTAMDERLDAKMEAWTSRVEEDNTKLLARVATLETQNRAQAVTMAEQADQLEEHGDTIEGLKTSQKRSNHREKLMWHYTRELRNHIVNELPPPPPVIPQELADWFDSFEDTEVS